MRNHLFSLLTAIFLVVSCQWVDAQQYLLNENFDGITSGVPAGWDDSDYDCSSSYRWKSDPGGHGGTRGLRFNTYSASSGTYSAVKTPVLNLNQAYVLRFWYCNYNAGTFQVFISTDGGATYPTALTQQLTSAVDGEWNEVEVSLSAYVGQSNVRIVFYGVSNYGTKRQYLDDVKVETAPQCKAPTGLYVSNLTTNSATLNWGLTADGDVPSVYQLTVNDEHGTTIVTDNNVPGTDITYALTGLTANTTYSVSMRGDCEASYSGYSTYASYTFTTACNTMSVPYTENFDGLSGIPDCTTSLNASIETSTKYGTSGKSLKLSATASESAFMIFPSLNHAANDIEMGFFAKSSISTALTFMVGIVSDPADIEGTFEPLYIDSIPNNTAWHEVRMNTSLASVSIAPVQMCVFIGSGKAGSLFIDDVNIHAIPSCVRPEQFRAYNPTSSSVDLSWTTSLASNHIIDIMAPDGTWSSVTATTNPYTVTGLQANSQYSFRLRALCAPGDTSEYASATVTAKTLCAPLTVATWTEGAETTAGSDLPDCWIYGWFNRPTSGTSYDQPFQTQTANVHSGTRSFQLRDMTSGAVSYLTSPGFTIDQPNVYQASIWVYRPSGTSSVGEGLHLFASNSPDDITGAQDLGFINRCAGNAPVEVLEEGTYGGWFKYTFPIAKTGVVYLIIQGESKYGAATNFDDVAVELAPTCLTPGDITIGAVSPNNDVTINWTAGASGETSWILAYDLKVGNTVVASDSLQVSSPNYTFTNLSAATTYSVNARVYAVCSPTDMSEPKNFRGSFSTPCGVITAFPYVQDFEEGTVPPNCWTNQVVATTSSGTANAWQSSSTYKHSGTYSAYIPDKSAGAKTALTTGELNFTDPNGYQVSFWMYRQSTSYQSKVDEAIHVFVSPSDSLDEATAVELGVVNAHYLNAPAEAASGWYQYTFDIPTSVTGSQYVSFCYHNQYGSGSYIDDVMIRPAPTCRDMANPVVIDIQPTSAIVMINDTSAHTWDISYGPSGTAAGAGTIVTVTDTNAYTLTGLTPNTNYDVYIRRNCGTEFGMWTLTPVTFTAICTPATATVTDAGAYDVTLQANANEWEISWGPQGTTAATGTIVPVSGTNTYTMTGLTPATNYVFYVRHNCSGVYSDWSSAINVKTTIVPDSIPFQTGFEDATDNNQWTIANGSNTTNHFVFGTDANAVASGSQALYIANNTSGTYGYNVGSATKTFAYRTIYFGSGVHNVSFKVKCTGGEASYDFASIMLVPASETLAGGSGTGASSIVWPNFVELFNPGSDQSLNYFTLVPGDADGWTTYSKDIDMTGREGTYNFAIMWNNDGSVGTSNYPVSIDNLSISQVTCNTPAVLSSGTTSTGTTITANSQTATQFEIAVSSTPIDVFGTVTGDIYQQITSDPVVLTGLTANTAYYYTARAICGVGDTSKWADAQTVRTQCDAYEAPYTETFEDAGALNCWSSNGNVAPTRNTSYHYAGTASMKVTDGAAVSPTINVTTLAESMLNGWAYSTTDSTVFSIGIMVDPEDGSTFEVLGSVLIPARNTWTEFTTYFNALEDPDYEDFYNAQHFCIVAGADATVYVDNLYLGDIPTCPKPTETTITNVLANTFTIGWTENGTATSWRVRAIPVADGQAVIDTVVTTNPANIEGLNAASAYDVDIRAICSAADTSLVTNCGRIKTTCDVVNTPYEENFELMTVQTIPDCWDNSGSTTSTATSTPHYVWGVYAQGGNQMIRMYNYYVSSGYTEIKSPVIAIGATGATLYFDLCHQASSGNMDVHISADGGANWTSIGSYAKTNTSTDNSVPQGWVTEEVDLAAYANQNVIIRFSNNANYGSGAIFVDNVMVRANLACTTPTALATVTPATAHDVQISWTAGGTETEWQVRVQNAAGTTYQNVTTNPCTITGLNAASNYNISVAAICGAGDTSYFCAPLAIATACDVVAAPINETFDAMPNNTVPNCWDNSESTSSTATSTPYYVWGVYSDGSNQMLRMYNYYVQSGTAEIVTSAYDLTGSANGYVLKFDYCHQASCGAFDVEISNDYGANWNTIGSYSNNSSSTSYSVPGDWTTVTYPLSNYIGDTILLRFFANANYGNGAIFVDNFRLLEARACADPIDFSVNPSDTFATVTINDPAAGHTQWQYVVVAANADTTGIEPILVDTNAFTLTGLTSSATYDIYVRAYCDPVEQSNWLTKSFQTTASPASFPYICQFTDSAENAQWMVYVNTSSPGCAFTVGNDPAALSPGQPAALYVYDGSGYGYNTGVSTSTGAFRLFRFEPSQYSLSFLWKCTGGEGNYDYARFYLVPASEEIYLPSTGSYSSSGWPASLIPLDGGTKVNLVSSPEWNSVDMILDMTNRAGSYYLAFIWSNDGSMGTSQYPLAINDIEISELTCLSPANISIPDSTITLTSAVVNYDDPNGAGTNVRWWINTTGLRNDTLQTGVVNASPFTISDLTSSVKYYLFMQAECSETEISPVAKATFRAACDVITTFPFTEDFEAPEFPAPCWENISLSSGDYYGEDYPGIWYRYSTTYSSSYMNGFGCAKLDGEVGASAILSTPPIQFQADREYHMSFYMYRATTSYYTDYVKVYLSDSQTSIAGATLLNHTVCYDPQTLSSGPVQISFDLPSGISGNKYIVFYGMYNNYGYVYIDDINIDIYPTCRDLNSVAVESTTATTMTVSADMGPNHQGVIFAYAPATAASVADTIGSVYSTTGTAVIQGLTAGTTYKVYARGVCSETDSTAWTDAITGTTMASDCFEPQNLHIVGIVGPTSATLAWGGAPDATGYEYQCIGTSIVDTIVNDTVVLTGLTPRTGYNFRVRTFCLTDTSAWVSLSFTTPTVPAELPYFCDFEDAVIANLWELNEGGTQYNEFIVGSATSNSGSMSLYITDDGSSCSYSIMDATSFASRLFQLNVGQQYAYSFDWNCTGESSYDYGRAFLVPGNVTLNPGTLPTGISSGIGVPNGWIALDNNTRLNQSSGWQTLSGTVTVPADGNYNLVFLWHNDGSVFNVPPLAIDNIQFAALTCSQPTVSVIAETVTETSAQFVVNNPNDSKDFIYFVSQGSLADAFFSDTVAGDGTDTVTITGLAGSSSYKIYVKAVCGVGDESFVVTETVRTACGTSTLPYNEGFEELPTSYTRGMIETICWSALNASQSSSTYPYYRASTSYATEGNQTLQTYSSNSTDLYLLLPSFGDVATCRVSFDCAYESLTSSGTFYVGYLTNPVDPTSFVNVYSAASQSGSTYTMESHVADIAGMPAGSRIAFKYSQGGSSNYYGWLDNIRVFQLVQGPTYADTICNGQPYANYGFNVPAANIQVGDNTFTRTKTGVAGAPDTVVTANVYMYPRFDEMIYDTTCAGQPYNGHGFSIQSPTTRTYQKSAGQSSAGCDSTVMLVLTVVPTYHEVYDTICEGQSYMFGGQTLTTTGDYTNVVTSPYGCDDTTMLHLNVVPTQFSTYESICKGTTFMWHGNSYNTAGTYTWNGQGAHGCTTTETLYLTVLDGDSTASVTICQGASYQFQDTVITTPGTYTRSYYDPQIDCNITITLTVTVDQMQPTHHYDVACEGKPYYGYSVSGVTITKDTVIVFNTKTIDGQCDSVSYVHLTFRATAHTDTTAEVYGETFTWHYNTYKASGDYSDTMYSVEGCDSIVTLHLILHGDGVDNVADVNMSIVPNPINAGATAFVYGEFGEVEKVEILNNFGQLVDSFVPDTYPIEVNGITASGLYYVRVTTKSGSVHLQKLMVK
ncbi:MAG: choice-of-anchor J domain-containing protein [Paludibacteraceae bacterium]|nr:choice-of-anchor J domain-containing protein [Paludibacteraceae bacterium]